MRHLIASLLLSASVVSSYAQTGPVGSGQSSVGPGFPRWTTGRIGSGAAASFMGLGDVGLTGTSQGYWSASRAYSSSTRGNRLVNVCNSTGGVDVGCADMHSDAVTGALVPATISGIPCPGANCTVKIIYDSSGGTVCSAGTVPCDVTVTAVVSRGTLVASCKNTRACVVCPTTISYNTTGMPATMPPGTFPVIAQPLSAASVVERTGNTSGFNAFVSLNDQNIQAFFSATPGTVGLFANNVSANVTAADNAAHGIQVVINNTSSAISVDGALTTGLNAGTNGASADLNICGAGNGNFLTGNFFEQGVWAGAFSAGDMSAAYNNQNSFYGGF